MADELTNSFIVMMMVVIRGCFFSLVCCRDANRIIEQFPIRNKVNRERLDCYLLYASSSGMWFVLFVVEEECAFDG